MIERRAFLDKARESLVGAESEFLYERYNNMANRAYYATFQSAIAALQQAGIRPRGEHWSHEFVPAQFEGVLINRRHRYLPELRGTLERNHALRRTGDYDEDPVSRSEAERALRRTRLFVTTIEGGEP